MLTTSNLDSCTRYIIFAVLNRMCFRCALVRGKYTINRPSFAVSADAANGRKSDNMPK